MTATQMIQNVFTEHRNLNDSVPTGYRLGKSVFHFFSVMRNYPVMGIKNAQLLCFMIV